MRVDSRPTNFNQYFLLTLGAILLFLGAFMVFEVRVWNQLGLWFSLAVVLLGLIMISSRIYSHPLGLLIFASGVVIVFHQVGIFGFPYFTTILGWGFIVVSLVMIVAAAVGVVRRAV